MLNRVRPAKSLAWALVLAAFLPVALAMAQQQPAARVIIVQGQVEVERDGRLQPVKAGQDLFPGDLVRTGPGSRAAILLADESRVKLNANSGLYLRAVQPRPAVGIIPAALRVGKTLLDMAIGELWLQTTVPPGTLEVRTPTVTAGIRGTEFNLSVIADGESRLAMLEGAVSFENPLGALVLQAGELGIARRGEAPVKQILVSPQDAVQWSLYYPGIYSFRDYPLVTADRGRLEQLLGPAQAELKAAPADPARQARVGELLHDLGRRDEARAMFGAAIATDPAHGLALTGLGWVLLEEGRTDEAIGRFDAVPEPVPATLLGLALARFQRGDFSGSAAALADATRRFGRSAPTLTQGALLDLLQGEVARARSALEDALRLDPGFALAHGLQSNIALVQNRKDEALEAAQRAVTANPASPSAQLDLALALQAHFRLENALEAARRAVALDPANARARLELARLLFGFDRIDDAAREIEAARRLAPNEPLVHAMRGFLLLARGETADADAAFQAALDAGATSGEAHLGRGLAAFRQGRREEGLRSFQAATLLEPRVSLFHSYLAKALYQLERREEALETLERARALDPRDPTPDLHAGVFFTDLNRPVDAIAALQRSVSLNDNRGIYRSRFLLDRDLATRNVDLSRAYVRLGQTERALALGIRALHEDPQSSSTHLFYASTLTARGAAVQGLSELAQTRLLLPVNQTTFNTFNDYTALLEAPRVQGSLEATVRERDTVEGSALVFGGTTKVAGSTLLSGSRTDGPKPLNSDDRTWSWLTLAKAAPSFRSSAFLQLFHTESKGGDTFANQQAFTPNDPDFRRRSRATSAEIGYQWQVKPGQNLLLYAQGQSDRIRTSDRSMLLSPVPPFEFLFPDVALRTTALLDTNSKEPYHDVQAAYLARLGEHQLWLAADHYRGKSSVEQRFRDFSDLVIFGFVFPLAPIDDTTTDRLTSEYLSLVLQDTWQIRPGVYATGALRYDSARDGDRFGPPRNRESKLSPQGGVLLRVTPEHTLRFAAFRALQTHSAARIAPTQMAGFAITTPFERSSSTTQYHAAWDAELGPATFTTLGVFRLDVASPVYDFSPTGLRVKEILERRRTGFNAAVNQILGRYWGASFAYLHSRREDPGIRADDDLVQLRLRFVHPTGFSAQADASWVEQNLGAARPPGAPRDFWFVSVAGGYEFPRKRARLTVGVENLFNERFEYRPDPLGPPTGPALLLPTRRAFATLLVNF